MTIFEGPPDENEAYEPFDEASDDEDIERPGAFNNPEGERDLDRELVADQLELKEIGANLDDPEQMSLLLDGAMDDPDGLEASVPRPRTSAEAEDLLDEDDGPEGGESSLQEDDDPELVTDPQLEEVPVDPMDLSESVADDAPGPDSARW